MNSRLKLEANSPGHDPVMVHTKSRTWTWENLVIFYFWFSCTTYFLSECQIWKKKCRNPAKEVILQLPPVRPEGKTAKKSRCIWKISSIHLLSLQIWINSQWSSNLLGLSCKLVSARSTPSQKKDTLSLGLKQRRMEINIHREPVHMVFK